MKNIVINYMIDRRSKMQELIWHLSPFPVSCAPISESLLAPATGQSSVKEVCEHIGVFFIRVATCFTFPLLHRCRVSRRIASNRVSWLANLDNLQPVQVDECMGEGAGGGGRRWRAGLKLAIQRDTDSQGKVSRSIVPALVSFINVIPVYEMRGALVFTWFPF